MKKIKITKDEKEKILKDLKDQLDKATTISDIEEIKVTKDKTIDKDITKPEIFISSGILEKMFALVDECSTECQWHGLVKKSTNLPSVYYIYDVLVFPQINSAASTDTDEEEYAEWLMELMQDEDENKFDDLRLHGHSHVNMQVYSSGIDDNFQKDILTNLKENDYYIFFILNKKRDICILLYDFEQNVMFETSDIKLSLTCGDEIISDWAKEELKKNNKKKTYRCNNTNVYSNWYDEYARDYYGYGYGYSYRNETSNNKKQRKNSKLKLQRRY